MAHAILLTGGSGQVGAELQRRAPADFEIVAPGRGDLDLTDAESLARAVAGRRWSAVINSGAYTAVDKAESDPLTAWRVNALAPVALAQATAAAGVPLIQVSTDYVFAGDKPDPYVEDDPLGPVGVYGASKAGGELAVATLNPRHVILRTAWVVSPFGANFVKTMLRLAETRDELRVVDDQRGCPTSAGDIAETLIVIARRLIEDPAGPAGTYHFVNAGEATWCGFARAIFEEAGRHGRKAPRVEAITTADYPTPARRPANSRLDTARLTRDFGIQPRPWRQAAAEVVDALLSA